MNIRMVFAFSGVLSVAACAALYGGTAPEAVDVQPALPPRVEMVRPNTGPLRGGIEVRILGANFDDLREGVVVRFGGVHSPRVVVDTPENLRAVLPPGERSGAVDIEVVNPDGSRGVVKEAFCYANGNAFTVMWFKTRLRLTLAWRFARLGGWIIAVLGAMSVGGLAWCIHLFLLLRPSELMPREFVEEVTLRIRRGELESASRLCEREEAAFARVIGPGLKKALDFPHQVREAIEAAGAREAAHLNQKISYLSNIGVVSPMLGLLGTIIGMIRAFEAIAEQGSRYVYLAAAIYQAMITTYAGLMVGIPAMILFFYFRGRVLRLVMAMEEQAERVAESVDAATTGAPK